jgi:predicted nucleic-acid-binding Zn-ribbon protein
MSHETDYSNDFVKTTVNRSRSLTCSRCGISLPMKTKVIFELEDGQFRAVYCMSCFNDDDHIQVALNDQRHPFDLED